ncbi:hypothetical protein ACFFOS_27640 [Nocardioides kongjuensis]|uniref:Uncharacterized protein n=1 Tax=Nocardioides kongjuensis TaxID=349522 RepID=A0A852S156_9ACTN|nr:hypothetical protein [Nocardioides kongjuensis]NYD33844.1 hypothetical protein [Nocardioides kongjuensis]
MTARINTLNALEQAEAEEAAGVPLHKIEEEGSLKVRLWGAIAWVITKRDEPTLSYLDYMKRATYSEILTFVLGTDNAAEEAAADDPFPAGAAAADEGAPADAEGPVLSGDGDPAV